MINPGCGSLKGRAVLEKVPAATVVLAVLACPWAVDASEPAPSQCDQACSKDDREVRGQALQERLQAAQQKRDQLEARHKTLQKQVRAEPAEESRATLRVEVRRVRLKLQQAKVDAARLEHEQAVFINEIAPGVFPSSTMRRLKLVEEVEALKLACQQLRDRDGRASPRDRGSGSPGSSERDDSRHQKRRTQLRLQIAEKVVKIIETEYHEMLRLPPNAISSEKFSKIKRRWKQAADRVERLRGGSAALGVCRSADGVGDCCGPVSRRRRSSGDARIP